MSNSPTILLLGSNIFNQKTYLESAKKLIYCDIGNIVFETKLLNNEPVGFTSKTNFLNQCLLIETNLSPIELLNTIKSIEKKVGRTERKPLAGELYASREIDIDILIYGQLNFFSERLIIPHPRAFERDFTLKLMKEIECYMSK